MNVITPVVSCWIGLACSSFVLPYPLVIAGDQSSTTQSHWEENLQLRADEYRGAILKWQKAAMGQVSARNVHIKDPQIEVIEQTGTILESEITRAADSLGEDHPTVLKNREALARLHRMRQAWDAAERQQRVVVATRNRLYGADDLVSIDAVDWLANDVSLQGKRKESVRLRRSAYESRKRVLGADHVRTLSSRSEYCVALMRAGAFKLGEAEYRALIAQDDRLRPMTFYPSQHRIDLASFLKRQGKKAAARIEAERAWRGFVDSVGEDSAAAKNALRMLNDLGDAEP